MKEDWTGIKQDFMKKAEPSGMMRRDCCDSAGFPACVRSSAALPKAPRDFLIQAAVLTLSGCSVANTANCELSITNGWEQRPVTYGWHTRSPGTGPLSSQLCSPGRCTRLLPSCHKS